MIRTTLAIAVLAALGAVLAATASATSSKLEGKVGPGYKIEVFAKGLNFPTNIAFKGNDAHFEA